MFSYSCKPWKDTERDRGKVGRSMICFRVLASFHLVGNPLDEWGKKIGDVIGKINFVDKQGINDHVIYLIEFAEMGTFRCVYFLFPWEIHHFGLGNRHGPKLIPRVADRLEQ